MVESEQSPSTGSLAEVRRLAGPSAAIRSIVRLMGGQHADTWRVDTVNPELSVVVRQFPPGDPAAAREQRVLRALHGLGGLAPAPLGGDPDGRSSGLPTSLISRLDGESNITPSDPLSWATALARALAMVHAAAGQQWADLPSVFDRRGGAREALNGPLAATVRARWAQVTTSPVVLTHSDYWSGNVVWRRQTVTGIVDWSGAARGPRGFDVGWCRLDLVLLQEESIADAFLAAYQHATGHTIDDIALWDGWAAARSHATVDTWAPNYAPLGRADLDGPELRHRHSQWTTRLLERL